MAEVLSLAELRRQQQKVREKDAEIKRLKNALYEFVEGNNEARDEIERLRAEMGDKDDEIERLKAALRFHRRPDLGGVERSAR